jgi:hypothetical protein
MEKNNKRFASCTFLYKCAIRIKNEIQEKLGDDFLYQLDYEGYTIYDNFQIIAKRATAKQIEVLKDIESQFRAYKIAR